MVTSTFNGTEYWYGFSVDLLDPDGEFEATSLSEDETTLETVEITSDAYEVRAASGAGDILSVARHVVGFFVKLLGLEGAVRSLRQRAGSCLRTRHPSPPPAPAGASVEV